MTRHNVKRFVSQQWVKHFITSIIIFNALLLTLSVYGFNTYWWEKGILILFTIEAALKIYGFRWTVYRSKKWNVFDLAIVIIGWSILLIAEFYAIPEWMAALVRILRLVRIGERFESTKNLLGTIEKSLPGIRSAGFLSALVVLMFILAGAKMFPTLPPFKGLVQTWLSVTFLHEDTVAFAMSSSQQGLILTYLYAFQFAVVLIFVNLFVTVMFDGMQKAKEANERPASKADIEALQNQLQKLEEQLARYNSQN